MFKKLMLVLGMFVALQGVTFAAEPSEMSFLYINGANNNDLKMEIWFLKGIGKLHPSLKKAFEKNPITKKHLLDDGQIKISDRPVVYFWGNKSRRDLDFMERNLAISKGVSPWLAFQVRWMIATIMHDAIWVQKYHNMKYVLEDVQKLVKEEAKAKKSVVLYGYSAGSFVTYQYLFNKLPYLTHEMLVNSKDRTPQEKEFVLQHPVKNTCLDGIIDANLAVLAMDGDIVSKENFDNFKKNYLALDKSTRKVCAPEGYIKGIVNYASPIPLFYSDISDPDYKLTQLNKLLYKYIIENDIFWITINYREDPLGFANSKNLTNEEIAKTMELEITQNGGFSYDDSNVSSHRTFLTAHTAYWRTNKTLSKAVAKAYEKGYTRSYDPTYGQKKPKQKKEKK